MPPSNPLQHTLLRTPHHLAPWGGSYLLLVAFLSDTQDLYVPITCAPSATSGTLPCGFSKCDALQGPTILWRGKESGLELEWANEHGFWQELRWGCRRQKSRLGLEAQASQASMSRLLG